MCVLVLMGRIQDFHRGVRHISTTGKIDEGNQMQDGNVSGGGRGVRQLSTTGKNDEVIKCKIGV